MCIYIYIYVCMCVYVYIYIYIYICDVYVHKSVMYTYICGFVCNGNSELTVKELYMRSYMQRQQ